MKKIFKVMLFLVSILLFVACGNEKSSKKRVIKVSTKFVDDEQTSKSLKKFVENVNKKSNGTLELQLFTSGTLPIGKDSMEQVEKGSDWISVDGVNFLGDYIPDYNAITGPLLYQSFEEYFRMLKTPLVQELNKQAEKKGIKVLSLEWVFGFRNFETNKAIYTPEDLNGMNIRVPNSKLYTYTIKALGGNPVAMPYPDTYAAIQQGVIDGVEGSIMSYYGTKQYENVKKYSLTRHLLGVSAVCISTKVWDSFTPEQRKLIEEELAAATKDNLDATEILEGQYAEKLREEGVEFNEVNAEAFSTAAETVFSQFPEWTPGIHAKIMENLKQIREDIKAGK